MNRLRRQAPWAVVLGLTAVLAVLLAASASCKKKAEPEPVTTSPAAPVETWVTYAPEGESFEILTPQAFECTTQQVPTEAGDIAAVSCLAQPSEQRMYIFVRSDMPEALVAGKDPLELVKGARDGLVRQYSAYVDVEKPGALGEAKGLEIGMQGAFKGTNFYIKARFFLVKNRLYQLYVVCQRGFEGAADFGKYLDSFKLK